MKIKDKFNKLLDDNRFIALVVYLGAFVFTIIFSIDF